MDLKPMVVKMLPVLDHGFVKLHNISGPTRRVVVEDGSDWRDFDADDIDPANTARMSFDQMGEDRTREMDLKLCDYLMRNKHTSPFEMVEVWIEMKMPIFVARQFVRHRTASINEVSGRYVQLPPEWYIPQVVGKKAKDKKQGQESGLYWQTADQFKHDLNEACKYGYKLYENAIMTDVAPEHARLFLHLNHYTHWIWKQDLHNLMHFLSLRVDSHAQIEAQEYANAIIALIRPHLPNSMALFDKYRRIQQDQVEQLAKVAEEILTMEAPKTDIYDRRSTDVKSIPAEMVDLSPLEQKLAGALTPPDSKITLERSDEIAKTEHLEPVGVSTAHINFTDMVRGLAKPGDAIIGGMTPAAAHCLHMAVGLMGEMTELLIAYNAKDRVNMIEELGDAEFFFMGLLQCEELQGVQMYDTTVQVDNFTPGSMTELIIEAGEIIDIAKRVAIYNDPSKWHLFKAQMPKFRVALNRFYEAVDIEVDEAVNGNIYKLALGPKARYRGGKYSDAAAIARADKQ